MKCIDRTELNSFISGKLDPTRMLEIDEHICKCADCRSALLESPAFKKTSAGLGAELLGVADCPEYEELSEYVDDKLAGDALMVMQAHVNSCELCSADVARIRDLRAQAELRDKIVVQQGKWARRQTNPFVIWKRVLAGMSAVAIIGGVAISLNGLDKKQTEPGKPAATQMAAENTTAPEKPNVSVKEPETTARPEQPANQPDTKPTVTATNPSPEQPVVKTPEPVVVSKPEYQTVLKDGSYSVIKKDGKLIFAKADGTPISNGMTSRIAEKLSHHSIKSAASAVVAVAAIPVRADNEDVDTLATPKLLGPSNKKILMSAQPTFKWSKVDLAEAYHFEITDKGGNPVYAKETDDSSLTISKPLERGQVYIWRVGVKFAESDSWTYSSAAAFKVLSSDDLAEIENVKRQMPGSHLALGTVYEYYGLYDEAVEQYRLLRRANSDSELAKNLLHKTMK